MKKLKILVSISVISLILSGCATYSAKVKDVHDIYHKAIIEGAPKVLLTDFQDNRLDKSKLGRVGALNVKSDTEIAIVLTNRVASKLKDEGFNIQKVTLARDLDQAKINELLNYNRGDIFLSGELYNFSISSFDAVLEKAKGNVKFDIKVFNKNSDIIFDKKYSVDAENWIGITGPWGTEKLIEQCVQSSVDELFRDSEFKNLLRRLKGK